LWGTAPPYKLGLVSEKSSALKPVNTPSTSPKQAGIMTVYERIIDSSGFIATSRGL
jgi:hypothetical protein